MSHWTSEDLKHRMERSLPNQHRSKHPGSHKIPMEYSIAEKEDLFRIPRNSHRPDLIPKPV